MKRFFILSLLALLAGLRSWACVHQETDNYYIFHAYSHDRSTDFDSRMFARWKAYAPDAAMGVYELGRIPPESFYGTDNALVVYAQKKGDQEMLAYLHLLNLYLNSVRTLSKMEGDWDYPTKQQLAEAKEQLRQVQQQALAYRGLHLRPRYQLLAMRASFQLKAYSQVVILWQKMSKGAASVYRDMAENLYAGVLLRRGKRAAAVDIYARQGDWESLQWAVRKERNLNGIRKVYASDPTSPLLRYLVEDFVHNAQETCDTREESKGLSPEDKSIFFAAVNRRAIYDKEVNDFIAFADEVVSEGAGDRALWQSATALLEYYYGRYESAHARAEQAVLMEGDRVERENARMVRLVTAIAFGENNDERGKFLIGELEWLKRKATQQVEGSEEQDYWRRMSERVYRQELPRMAARWQRPELALFILQNKDVCYEFLRDEQRQGDEQEEPYTDFFRNPFALQLENMTTAGVKDYWYKLNHPSDEVFVEWARKGAYKSENFYYDYLGTRLVSEGKFSDAIPFLELVPLKFLSKQGIAFYASQRTYKKEAWMDPQWTRGDEYADTPIVLIRNQKIDYCRDVLDLQSRYAKAKGEKRYELAYQLASYYYQASSVGRCWYLTRYYYSTYYGDYAKDSVETNYRGFPFLTYAEELLAEAAQSKNPRLREKVFFAQAFLPYDPPLFNGYWEEEINFAEAVNHQSPGYAALARLFALERTQKPSDYVSSCGIYRAFVRLQE